ncbi:hypothetical protein ACOME3_000783 [Neoechinorhynchus agilis]
MWIFLFSNDFFIYFLFTFKIKNQTRNIESCFLTKTENPLNGRLSDSCRIGDITSSELFTGAILLDDRTESFNAFNRLMPVKTDMKALDGRFLYGKNAVTSDFLKVSPF